jgi:hypothetical protein
VNSEELETSLRSEFESYLKGLQAEMRQHADELQSKFESEMENHRSQMADAFRAYSERFDSEHERQRSQMTEAFRAYTERLDSEHEFDAAFTSSVTEHLRLARDEGSKIAATAMAEAEDLRDASAAAAPADYTGLRDAIADISKQDSQSAILKSLVNHAANFAPRGAFFIIKSEHFVGWKVFGEDSEGEDAIRDIHFPVSADTVLGEAVRGLATTESSSGGHAADAGSFLDALNYGHPDRMYAIPLVARGRGVAVLYADYGASGMNLNVEALETLVNIAGLTVELLAATQTVRSETYQPAAADFEDTRDEYQTLSETPASGYQPFEPPAPVGYQEPAPEVDYQEFTQPEPAQESAHEFDYSAESGYKEPAAEYQPVDEQFEETTQEYTPVEVEAEERAPDFAFGTPETAVEETAHRDPFGYEEQPTAQFETTQPDFSETQTIPEVDDGFAPVRDDFGSPDTGGAMVFDETPAIEPAMPEPSPFEAPSGEFEPAVAGVSTKPESAVEVSPSNAGYARLSDRPVDLPIEVAEDERRLHNDARRFARLLVSEIKLYNEKKVQEGRESRDLYERLREAIDRSREMYDKRVQPPVASKFDYFHYELVNALAEGQADRLGSGYPGSRI